MKTLMVFVWERKNEEEGKRRLELLIVNTSNQMHKGHPHKGLENLLKTNHLYLKDEYGLLPLCPASKNERNKEQCMLKIVIHQPKNRPTLTSLFSVQCIN